MHSIGPLSVSDLPAIKFDGVYRVLACIRSDDSHDFPNFGDSLRSAGTFELREIDLSWHKHRIMDQGTTSSCVGQTCAAGMETCWRQHGNAPLSFNPYYVYGCINRGRDQGAMISDGLTALRTKGVCPLDALPADVMYENQFPESARVAARRFRLAQAYKCRDFDEICQAINLGFTVPLGIMVGANFTRLDGDGVAPLPMGGGGGHAILGVGLKRSQRFGWLVKIQNSWGERFGLRGYCYLHKGHFERIPPDAFAIQATFDDPQDNTPEDEVPVVTG